MKPLYPQAGRRLRKASGTNTSTARTAASQDDDARLRRKLNDAIASGLEVRLFVDPEHGPAQLEAAQPQPARAARWCAEREVYLENRHVEAARAQQLIADKTRDRIVTSPPGQARPDRTGPDRSSPECSWCR